jgi:phospholipase D1/2
MQDPVADTFFNDVWQMVAENNTKIFRQVFRCQPDNDVKTWQQYKEYTAFSQRFAESQGLGKTPARAQQNSRGKSGPPGDVLTNPLAHMEEMAEKVMSGRHSKEKDSNTATNELPKGTVEEWAADQEKKVEHDEPIFSPSIEDEEHKKEGVAARDFHDTRGNGIVEARRNVGTEDNGSKSDLGRQRTVTISEPNKEKDSRTTTPVDSSNTRSSPGGKGSQRRRRRTTTRSTHRPFHHEDADMLLPKEDAEELLKLVQGSLVVFPYDWLAEADEKGQFIYAVDALAPLEV